MAAYLFDACIPPQVAQALQIVGYNTYHVKTAPGLSQASKDDEIMAWCPQYQATLVTADYSIKRTREYARLLRRFEVSAAFFRPPSKKGWNRKEWHQQVVKRMDHMEKVFVKQSPCYYRYPARGSAEKMVI
jgi:hypothetical protein